MRYNQAMRVVGLLGTLFVVVGCNSVYYNVWESLGYAKRDLLVSNVEQARDDQEQAKEEFKSALERFTEVVDVDGGELEVKYNKLRTDLDRCEGAAEDVRERIDDVESVAKALFNEWESELDQYSSADLRRASEKQLKETQKRYDQLIGAMQKAESKMEPVLAAFQDQVLFLKHNLNARAIASLQGAAVELESDVSKLIKDMEASIDEANDFIASMSHDEPAA